MATLKQYFDTDFSRVLNAATMWSANCLGQIVEVTARTHFDFDAGVKFISFYLPQCGNARQVCRELLANSPKLLTETESKISVRAGFAGEKADDIKELKFSGRVFIYSETPMDSDDMRLLEEYAGRVGLSCRIRSQDMVRSRSALEKPLAFISHDSQDKAEIARPLAVKLSQLMCPVWYDEFALKVGDSLRESIESGLKQCKKCVLVLSPYFLSNIGWTKVEFNSVFTRELVEQQKVVLPVWCGVSRAEVYDYSPTLADRYAANWSAGIDEVARALYRAITANG
jgi:TIR domain-containing protein